MKWILPAFVIAVIGGLVISYFGAQEASYGALGIDWKFAGVIAGVMAISGPCAVYIAIRLSDGAPQP